MENIMKDWLEVRYQKIAIFNIVLVMLVLLRSAGYFEPFFIISINFIVFFSLILSVILLSLDSKFMFFMALMFWIFAAFIKISGIDIWAERAAIYAYQALVIGALLFIFERFREREGETY